MELRGRRAVGRERRVSIYLSILFLAYCSIASNNETRYARHCTLFAVGSLRMCRARKRASYCWSMRIPAVHFWWGQASTIPEVTACRWRTGKRAGATMWNITRLSRLTMAAFLSPPTKRSPAYRPSLWRTVVSIFSLILVFSIRRNSIIWYTKFYLYEKFIVY